MKRTFLTEKELRNLAPGSPCYVLKGTCFTPLALEFAAERGNAIVECDTPEEIQRLKAFDKRLALDAAPSQRELGRKIRSLLQENGYLVCECGARSSPDEPGNVLGVVQLIQNGQVCSGIWLDEDGIGSTILANKCPGIRAVHCWDRQTARISRERHGANLLVLADPGLDADLAAMVVTTWLSAAFARAGHSPEISLLEEVEKKNLRETIMAVPGDCSCAL
ncbi:MAG: RpiB/LacA/LacB family sugar-phosphate isomerase [Acidobacteria bacterium]|nr:RpiB/LacA/LacB family sugar-phosphate isomerase [Acidobacteriota bacterium]